MHKLEHNTLIIEDSRTLSTYFVVTSGIVWVGCIDASVYTYFYEVVTKKKCIIILFDIDMCKSHS